MSKTESKSQKTNINQKIVKLDQAVEWFYSEDFSLDQATEHYQKTLDLASDIKKDLSELKNQIEVLSKDFTKS